MAAKRALALLVTLHGVRVQGQKTFATKLMATNCFYLAVLFRSTNRALETHLVGCQKIIPKKKIAKMNSNWARAEWEDLPQEKEVNGVMLDEHHIETQALQSPYWKSWQSLGIDPSQRPSTEPRKTFCSNRLATNEVIQRSKDSEYQFGQVAQSKSIEWFEASDLEDMKYHTDCFLRSSGICLPKGLYPIDVKAYKPLSAGKQVQTQYLWLEVHCKGFVFSGLSTCIAVQYSAKKFVILHKKALQSFIQTNIKNLRPVVRNKQALYRLYKREEKKEEWLTLVDFLDCVGKCAIDIF